MTDIDQVICVDQWRLDVTYGDVYPEGSREKAVYFSPGNRSFPQIKPGHNYLLKKSFARYPWQFWMEVIAYRIGDVIGIPVPLTCVGLHHQSQDSDPEYGALIEWFYKEFEMSYFDGGRLMTEAIKDFDVKHGTQHNFQSIVNLPVFKDIQEQILSCWADILTFDTIIGNTDRHQNNWGIILEFDWACLDGKEFNSIWDLHQRRLSPAFDNGTALNHEILEENFQRFEDEKYLLHYLTNPKHAKHHMKWSLGDTAPINFYVFMKRLVTEYPFVKERVLKRLDFSQADIESRLMGLPAILDDPTCRLTERRLTFTIRMLMKRRELLLKALNE